MICYTPLISLARIGYPRLLLDIPDRVVLPLAVAQEIEAGLQEDPARLAMVPGMFFIAGVYPESQPSLRLTLVPYRGYHSPASYPSQKSVHAHALAPGAQPAARRLG